MKTAVVLSSFAIFLLCIISHVTGACTNLPDVWTQGEWFSHYENGYSWVAVYSDVDYLLKVPNIPTVVTAAYSCHHNQQSSKRSQILLVNNNRYYCMRVTTPTNALSLLVQFTNAPENARVASDCNGNFGASLVSWQVRFPLDLNYAPCPFGAKGTKYQATVWDGLSWRCENDKLSTLEVVSGNRMVVNTCVNRNDYGSPLKGATLYCKGHVSGTEIENTDNVFLLAYKDGASIRFYCGRYKEEGNTVVFSLNTKNSQKPSCELGASATTTAYGYAAFRLSRWAPNIAAPKRPTTVALGPCSFPPRWRPIKWFTGYRTRLGGADAHIYRFDDSSLRQVSTVNPWAADWILSCEEARYSPPHYYYHLNGEQCMSYTEINPQLLIYKHIVLGSRFPTVNLCIHELNRSSFTTIIVPYQNYSSGKLADGESECPFPVGQYQTTFIDENFQENCQNDNKSMTTVGNSDIRIKTCVKTNTYESPYYVDLTCVTSWRKDEVRTLETGDGDYLLLSYYDKKRARTHYYVARYRINGGQISLSLHVNGNGQHINFDAAATAKKSGPHYRSFTLKRTATSDCGCMFGECVTENGKKRCRCYQGYVGVNCETSLPTGTCADKGACKNSAKCVDVPTDIGRSYFYCRCATGYAGLHCELKDPCYPNPCSNGGDCSPLGAGFRCSCRPTYMGTSCQRRLATVEETGEKDNTLIIALVTSIGIVLLAVVIGAIIVRQRRLKRKEGDIPTNPDSDMPKQNPKMQAWYADYKETYKSQMASSEEKTLEDY